jgi:hypothetical protein
MCKRFDDLFLLMSLFLLTTMQVKRQKHPITLVIRITLLLGLHYLIQITLHGIQYQIVLYNNVQEAQVLTTVAFYH